MVSQVVGPMDPFKDAVKKFRESDKKTQNGLVELYDALKGLPSGNQIEAILKKLGDFGINERRKEGCRLLPMTMRQLLSINKLLPPGGQSIAITRELVDTIRSLPSTMPPLPSYPHLSPSEARRLISNVIPFYSKWVEEDPPLPSNLDHLRIPQLPSAPPLPLVYLPNLGGQSEVTPLNYKVDHSHNGLVRSGLWDIEPYRLPGVPQIPDRWDPVPYHLNRSESKVIPYESTTSSFIAKQLKQRLLERLADENGNPEEAVREYMEIVGGLQNDTGIVDSTIDVVRLLEELGWTSVGFLKPVDRGALLVVLKKGSLTVGEWQAANAGLTVSGKRRLQSTPLVIDIVKNLIEDLSDPTKDAILEFKETIDAISLEEPIVKKETELILTLLDRAHLTTKENLAKELKSLID